MFRRRETLLKVVIWFIVITMVLAFAAALIPALS